MDNFAKSKTKIIMTSLLFLTFSALLVFAENPSKEETINYLLDILNCKPRSHLTQKAEYDNGNLIITTFNHSTGKYTGKTIYPLSKLNPERIEVVYSGNDSYYIFLNTTNEKDEILDDSVKISSFFFELRTEYMANKAKKALEYLIKLHGGKNELF